MFYCMAWVLLCHQDSKFLCDSGNIAFSLVFIWLHESLQTFMNEQDRILFTSMNFTFEDTNWNFLDWVMCKCCRMLSIEQSSHYHHHNSCDYSPETPRIQPVDMHSQKKDRRRVARPSSHISANPWCSWLSAVCNSSLIAYGLMVSGDARVYARWKVNEWETPSCSRKCTIMLASAALGVILSLSM